MDYYASTIKHHRSPWQHELFTACLGRSGSEAGGGACCTETKAWLGIVIRANPRVLIRAHTHIYNIYICIIYIQMFVHLYVHMYDICMDLYGYWCIKIEVDTLVYIANDRVSSLMFMFYTNVIQLKINPNKQNMTKSTISWWKPLCSVSPLWEPAVAFCLILVEGYCINLYDAHGIIPKNDVHVNCDHDHHSPGNAHTNHTELSINPVKIWLQDDPVLGHQCFVAYLVWRLTSSVATCFN